MFLTVLKPGGGWAGTGELWATVTVGTVLVGALHALSRGSVSLN